MSPFFLQEGRYRAKRLLVLALYDLCYNERQASEIFRLLDWTMHLRVDLEKRAEALLRFQPLADLQNGLEQYGGPGV
jgi:hypothetical protein